MKAKLWMVILLSAIFFTQEVMALSWWDMSPDEVRERINQRIMAVDAPTPAVDSIIERCISRDQRNTPLRIYKPINGNDSPIILLIHGGAWVAGNLDTHDNLARYLCSEAQAVVISVGYLNSPEGKFPLPLEQCYDALLWATEHANECFGDASRLAVVGDSAGGNMAAALCLMARDRSGPKIGLQVLINPVLDLTTYGTVERQGDVLDILRWQVVQYLSNPSDASHCYVSPQLANDFRGVPAAVILLAEKDELRDNGQKYADQLLAAGIPTQVYCQQGVGHLAGDGARASLRARESLDIAVTALKNAFSRSALILTESN
jgi:acetyl esterase